MSSSEKISQELGKLIYQLLGKVILENVEDQHVQQLTITKKRT